MLNEKRVRLMTRMAMYETKEGKEDFKISAYYQKDYASLNTWITAIWSTIGYIVLVGLICLVYLDEILKSMSMARMIIIAGMIVGGYFMTLLVSGIIAHTICRKRHIEARKRVKKFNHDLIYLDKMYEKEIR